MSGSFGKRFNISLLIMATIAVVVSLVPLSTLAEPPTMQGNPGIPGLLYELENQIYDQAATIEELQATIDALEAAIAAMVPAPLRRGRLKSVSNGHSVRW